MTKSMVWMITFLLFLSCVLGQLEAPQNVTLISENFRYVANWKPGAGSPPDTRYTVEAFQLKNAKKNFTSVKKCTNITALSCDLSQRFRSYSSIYWVRVKSISERFESSWVESNELLPSRDTILGPPIMNVTSNLQTIEVSLDMPVTPQKHRNDSKLKALMDIDPHLIYIIILVDKKDQEYANVKVIPDRRSGKGYYLFENLKPNFIYCVVASFESLINFNLKNDKKICVSTSTQNTDILWLAPLIAAGIFIIGVIVTGILIWLLKEFTYLHFVQSQLPKSLVIISQDFHVNLQCQELDENLEDDHLSFIAHDDHSNDHYQKSQRIAVGFIDDISEKDFDQSNGLNCVSYECNRLLKGTNCENERLPSSSQASMENNNGAGFTKNISPGVPATSHLQYRQMYKDAEEPSKMTVEAIPPPESMYHHFGSVHKIKIETNKIELWNCVDVPLSSVKLSINDELEKDHLKVNSCADETSDQLKVDDLCSQFTSHLTAAINPPLNGIQGYEAQSIKLPQTEDNYKFQYLVQKPCSYISDPNWMTFSEYEAH
ncbi:interleukin-10 receptor subunit beta-like [Narcine bancroftii]|uniref:interleukin-10 receptor subunit beta-like n=1 Tax=Narcine bancroftii TaxID=1343680 RepID=UPI003831694C